MTLFGTVVAFLVGYHRKHKDAGEPDEVVRDWAKSTRAAHGIGVGASIIALSLFLAPGYVSADGGELLLGLQIALIGCANCGAFHVHFAALSFLSEQF